MPADLLRKMFFLSTLGKPFLAAAWWDFDQTNKRSFLFSIDLVWDYKLLFTGPAPIGARLEKYWFDLAYL